MVYSVICHRTAKEYDLTLYEAYILSYFQSFPDWHTCDAVKDNLPLVGSWKAAVKAIKHLEGKRLLHQTESPQGFQVYKFRQS